MEASIPLLPVLKQYFGFNSFRPLQQEIIRNALDGRDVFALLPTGGGKSLCFQLPALIRPGLTVVVSPLIALMKDQVDSLHASGIPATFLNSSLEGSQSRERLRGLHHAEYRLLYVAPERLMLSGFLSDLKQWQVNLIAIDEAHCISEWGHDFRPEYRQLTELRSHLPNVPIMALTATATTRVRQDIINLLKLREPKCYVASFNRPNLTYQVVPRKKPYEQLVSFLRKRRRESGIVYCQARKTAESLAERLNEDGITARPYHAGLLGRERTKHQESFLRDEVRVICATIAFGMGINKPNVRFVVHYDLPKNIEGYYQETGRAGRDGLPSDCVLLFSPGDVIKQLRFIDEKPDPKERSLARGQLEQMIHYAENGSCRRRELLQYFGEKFSIENCGACDNCLSPRETYDGTLAAQKFLSCVYRIRQQSGFDFGMNQIADVLTGEDTDNVHKWNHQKLSTYGIGREITRADWKLIGRELIRLGFLKQSADKFPALALTPEGLAALKKRNKVTLTRPARAPRTQSHRAGEIGCDEILFARLCELRKRFADERNVPTHVILSDVTLRKIAREYPRNKAELARISGMIEKKIVEFGSDLLEETAAHLQANPRQIFADDSFDSAASLPGRASIGDTARQSLRRFRAGESAEEIASARLLTSGTIYGHLAEALEAGEEIDLNRFVNSQEQSEIAAAFEKLGFTSLSSVFQWLGGRYDYGRLRVLRAAYRQTLKPASQPQNQRV